MQKERKKLKETHIKSSGPLNRNSKYKMSRTNSNNKTVIIKNDQERFNPEQERKRDQAKERARIEDEMDNIVMMRYDNLKKEEAKQEEAKDEVTLKRIGYKKKEVAFNKKGKSGDQPEGETKNTGPNKQHYQDEHQYEQQCDPSSPFNSPPTQNNYQHGQNQGQNQTWNSTWTNNYEDVSKFTPSPHFVPDSQQQFNMSNIHRMQWSNQQQ